MKSVFYALIILAHFSTVAQSIEKSKINQIDSLFSEWDKSNSPGCILGVIKDGNFIKNGFDKRLDKYKKVVKDLNFSLIESQLSSK